METVQNKKMVHIEYSKKAREISYAIPWWHIYN